MSVRTTADDKVEEAKEHLRQAYKALLVAMDEDTWGYADYSEEYLNTIRKVSGKIVKWKSKL